MIITIITLFIVLISTWTAVGRMFYDTEGFIVLPAVLITVLVVASFVAIITANPDVLVVNTEPHTKVMCEVVPTDSD